MEKVKQKLSAWLNTLVNWPFNVHQTHCLWIIDRLNILNTVTHWGQYFLLSLLTEYRVCQCSLLHCYFIMAKCDGMSVPIQQPIYQLVTTQPPVVRQGTAESDRRRDGGRQRWGNERWRRTERMQEEKQMMYDKQMLLLQSHLKPFLGLLVS